MKAKELAEKLMEHPEAEVVREKMLGPEVMLAERVSFGYYSRKDGGFFYGLEDTEDIEPNKHVVMAVLVE